MSLETASSTSSGVQLLRPSQISSLEYENEIVKVEYGKELNYTRDGVIRIPRGTKHSSVFYLSISCNERRFSRLFDLNRLRGKVLSRTS